MKNREISVFIIEDDKLQNRMMQEAISTQFKDVKIMPFFSAESALGNMNRKPDFIIIDHFLDKLNGIESLPIFREFAPNSKIIVISSQHDIKNFENAFHYGADAYYTKDGNSIKNVISYLKKEIADIQSSWFTSLVKKISSGVKPKTNKLIYILEDNLNSAFSIEHTLQNGTLNRVLSFQNSIDFMTQVRVAKPDVVILDYYLDEKLSGKEVLKSVNDTCENTEVIIFSNQTDVTIATELKKMGASHFFTKNNENLLRIKSIVNP